MIRLKFKFPLVATALAVSLTLGTGCLSVVRIPMPGSGRYSDDGVCTNRVWHSFCDEVPGMRVYPTIKMRCRITGAYMEPIPAELKGEELYKARMFKRWGWIPLGLVWLTSPVDACVDTLFLPWDCYVVSRKAKEQEIVK